MLEVDDLGGDVEVAVVVQDSDPVLSCQDGGQQIGDADRSVPASPPGQGTLGTERDLPMGVVSGHVLVCVATVCSHLLVLPRTASAEERFGVEGGADRYQTTGDQGLQPVGDDRQPSEPPRWCR